ncbi:MAG: nucleotidyl transferase AbiEii/AbiGii toxin family protein [Proteobacteria bacterium]|nr:nucleotidyl transferase AbiEii/AbiGii toxin family protein [Pseudomonadota bacterium]
MKTITSERKRDIEDATAAGLFGIIPPAVIEKDLHVTDALREISRVKVTHIARRAGAKAASIADEIEVSARLIFAGGTCLSKAYGLIERMSEDIDIKVVLDEVPEGYALLGGVGDRARLKDLQGQIERCLKAVGYEVVVADDNPLARDKHRYYCLAVSYEASFKDISAALRPELKLELIHRPPLLPVANKGMKSLFDQRISSDESVFSMPCISVAETLAEKVLSLLRRCAWLWGGCQRGEFDTALVRHIYDVWRIDASMPEVLSEAEKIFRALVEKDVEEFRGQCPGFDARPFDVLRETLADPRMVSELREYFDRRLLPLLFSEEIPAFEECFAHFASVARRFLATG